MEYITRLDQIVTGFAVTSQYIDCMCGTNLVKIEKSSGHIVFTKQIFEKEGLSRNLAADHGQIFIYDFCMLYAVNQNSYELLGKWQLGTDLSSDICGLLITQHTIYCSMRNGKLITLDRNSFACNETKITDSSMWSIKPYQNHLVCGTVDGKILLLNQATCVIEKELTLGKQNIRGLYIDHETLYAAGQDKKLYQINLVDFSVDRIVRNAHPRMFECIGLYNTMLITISYPAGEIILWEKETLEKKKVIKLPLKLDGRAVIDNDVLYLTSRNMSGIIRIACKTEF